MYQTVREYRDFRKRKLSASNQGKGILVGTSNTLIHSAIDSAAANEWDAITLQAVNNSGSTVMLTIQWGSNASADRIVVTVPSQSGLVEVVSGLILHDGLDVNASAATSDVVMVHGYVHRYEYSRP